MSDTKPIFVVFEGLDGSGKSDISKIIAEKIKAEWMSTPLPELSDCRKSADELYKNCGLAAQLFYAATCVHASDRVTEYLRAEKSVVMDRYVLSTLAYDKSVRESGLPDSLWIDRVFGKIEIPRVVIYLDVPPKIRKQRMEKKRKTLDHTDKESLVKFEAVQKRYQTLFPKFRCHKKPWRITSIKNEGSMEECVEKCLVAIHQLA